MGALSVYCEGETEFLYIIYMKFGLQKVQAGSLRPLTANAGVRSRGKSM